MKVNAVNMKYIKKMRNILKMKINELIKLKNDKQKIMLDF